MDLYDILFFVIFMGVWFFLVAKVFPKFGVGGWGIPPKNLQVEDNENIEKNESEKNKNNRCS